MKTPARSFQLTTLLLLSVLCGLTIYAHRLLSAPGTSVPEVQRTPSPAPAHISRREHQPIPVKTTEPAVRAAEPETINPQELALEPLQSGGSFNLMPSLIAGGGGASAGGSNTVTGSIGQSVASTSSGGNFSIVGGFWGGAASGNCPTITLTPATLPNGQLGALYSQQLSQTGGVGTISWSSTGVLPNNVSLNPTTGLLSGTPTASGTFTFTVKATDQNGCFGTQAYTVSIGSCPPITVNPATLPAGSAFTFYNQQLSQTGGTGAITWSVSAGALPAGLTLNAASGLLSGAATVSGIFNFSIKATDANNCAGTQAYTLTINPNLGLMFFPLAHPVRLLDTRAGQLACFTPGAPIAGGTSRTQAARGVCDGLLIPANAAALTGNITTVQSGGGFLTLYPSDAAQPLVANSNYNPNEILNNVFTVGLGNADGAFKIFVTSTTDIVIDVTGYYAPPGVANPSGLYFHPLPKPIRLLETRAGLTGCTTPNMPLPGNADTLQSVRLTCDGVTIPNSALAIVGNATTVNSGGPGGGYLTLFPADAARPLVASSNYLPGQVMNAPFTVGLSPAGQFKIYPTSQTDLVVDVLGYYSVEASDTNGLGLLFNPLPHPVRLLETRAGFGGCFTTGAPLLGGSTRIQPARGVCDGVQIAVNALGIVGNATVVNSNGGYLTFWPSTAAQPLVATSNFTAGQVFNRHFTVGLGAGDGAFNIFTFFTTDLVIDVSGYFAP